MHPLYLLIPIGLYLAASSRPKPPPPRPAPGQAALDAARLIAPRATAAAELGARTLQHHQARQQQAARPDTPAPRRPGDAARRRSKRHSDRAQRFRDRAAQLRARGVYVDEVIGWELESAGEAAAVFNVGELDRWMDREAKSAGYLLARAARCAGNRQAVFVAHGWKVTFASPRFSTWSVVAVWQGAGAPTQADRLYVAKMARAAGAQGGMDDRGSMLIFRWKGGA